ncbi:MULTISPECIES: penicillin-binding protein 1A [Spirosoma]|uniref:Transglycosylase domain-containing protein n=1 Tax=Spirosoma liriopis TaxID=2937440 RepID=A0ABT0HGA3_9BACT|nr:MULTISPECIES: transglycosylase domain-containing protein [Spirosoma]MCK8491174.1 transglycosylase domain-containing protein [Spirosoma liriopis]UHG90550.1 transglycosylase domain-containing protein [Spirosoma oryzicola]
MIEFAPGRYRTLIKNLWRYALLGLVLMVFYIVAVSYNVFWLFGGMPSLKALENPQSEEASEVYTADNQLLGKYYVENRTPVEITQVSPNVVSALLATEDARFIKHSGIDPRSFFRVIKGIATGNSSSGGGSTLTQQVAKNLFDTRGEKLRGALGNIPVLKTVIEKTKEWILSVRLERNYTKQEIMMMYLNTVSFGNNTYGIKTAAKTYFNKEPWQLSVDESALLVGMLQNPSRYDPRIFEDRAFQRRNVVLSQMERYGFLNKEQFVTYKTKPIKLDFSIENQNTGMAAYFRSVIRDDIKAFINQYNEDNPDAELDLYTSGLRIYTTIDSRMQTYAEEAVMANMRDQQKKFYEHWRGRNPWVKKNPKTKKYEELPGFIEARAKQTTRYKQLKAAYGNDEKKIWSEMRKPVKMKVFVYGGRRNEKDTTMSPLDSMRYYKRLLNTGFMSMDPRYGHVKAWVGGINFKHMKFDHVRQGRRQPGSTFKPFVYLTAMDQGFVTPCSQITDQPTTFLHGEDNNNGPAWTPKNSTGRYSYRGLTLREALGQSINTVSAQLIKKTRAEAVIKYAHNMGIQSKDLPENPTLCLGTGDVSVYEMVSAYCAFANGGIRVRPMIILRITDKHGNVLKSFSADANQVISANRAYEMLYLMRGAVEEPNGTAQRLRTQYKLLEGGNEIAAKTGTTSNYSDAWFMGMTQHLVSGLWVGGDDRSIHFRTIELGQGGRMAMPAWGMYMQKIYADPTLTQYRPEPFRKPNNFKIDCGGYHIDSTQRYIPPKVVPEDEDEILQ